MVRFYSVRWLVCFFVIVNCNTFAHAERPKVNFPHTDIFLFDLELFDDVAIISNGKNVTNRKGYDNQPYFTSKSESFVFSRGDDYQTDVYEYFVNSGEIKRVTRSDATEFSPTPNAANDSLLFVSDRNNNIWQANRNAPNDAQWFMQPSGNMEPVGYFAFNEKTNDLLYWSRYGSSVKLANQERRSFHFVAGNTPPATPHVIPKTDNFSFVHRQFNEQVWIKMLNPETRSITPLIMINGRNFNYTWAPDQSLFMIQEGVLFRAKPFESESWVKVAALKDFAIETANRLAISPNGKHIAIVGVAAD